MTDTPNNVLDLLKAWGWYHPREQLTQVLQTQLQRVLPESALLSLKVIAYHQDRDHVLLRRRDEPARVVIVQLGSNSLRKENSNRRPLIFDGTFSEFAIREQKRHEIEQRMIKEQNKVSGFCPVCFTAIEDGLCGGIWTGSTNSKAANGPLYSATCKSCHSLLVATPTHEECEKGIFIWEFEKWGENSA